VLAIGLDDDDVVIATGFILGIFHHQTVSLFGRIVSQRLKVETQEFAFLGFDLLDRQGVSIKGCDFDHPLEGLPQGPDQPNVPGIDGHIAFDLSGDLKSHLGLGRIIGQYGKALAKGGTAAISGFDQDADIFPAACRNVPRIRGN